MSGVVINSFLFSEILGTAQKARNVWQTELQPEAPSAHAITASHPAPALRGEHGTGTSSPEYLQPLIILQSPLLHQTQPSWLPTSVSDAEQQWLLLTQKGGTPPLKMHLPTASEMTSHLRKKPSNFFKKLSFANTYSVPHHQSLEEIFKWVNAK